MLILLTWKQTFLAPKKLLGRRMFAVYIHLRDILVSFDDIISLLVYSFYSSLSRVNVRTRVYSEPIQIHPPN